MTGGPRPVRLVTARRSNEASSYKIYTDKMFRSLTAAGRPAVTVREVDMGAEGRRGGVLRPTFRHLFGRFPRDGAIYHATEPNTALRGVDVVTFHDLYAFDASGPAFRIFRYVIRSAARRARRIVTQAPSIREDIRRHLGAAAADRTRIVPPAFPAPPPGRRPEAYDVLWVGSLDARKRPDQFLERLAERRGAPLRVAFLCHPGGSPLEPSVRAALSRIGDRHHVDWIVDNVSTERLDELYRSARAFVSTSIVEGFHYPVMEAYSRGTPVVLPRTSPYPETYGSVVGVHYYEPSGGFDAALDEALAEGPVVPDGALLDSISYASVGRRLSAVYDELG